MVPFGKLLWPSLLTTLGEWAMVVLQRTSFIWDVDLSHAFSATLGLMTFGGWFPVVMFVQYVGQYFNIFKYWIKLCSTGFLGLGCNQTQNLFTGITILTCQMELGCCSYCTVALNIPFKTCTFLVCYESFHILLNKCKRYRLCRQNGKRTFLICTECTVTLRWLVDWRLEETRCMLAQVNIYEWVDTVNWLFTAPLECKALVFRAHTPPRHFQPISWESACRALVCIWWAVCSFSGFLYSYKCSLCVSWLLSRNSHGFFSFVSSLLAVLHPASSWIRSSFPLPESCCRSR